MKRLFIFALLFAVLAFIPMSTGRDTTRPQPKLRPPHFPASLIPSLPQPQKPLRPHKNKPDPNGPIPDPNQPNGLDNRPIAPYRGGPNDPINDPDNYPNGVIPTHFELPKRSFSQPRSYGPDSLSETPDYSSYEANDALHMQYTGQHAPPLANGF